MNNPIERVCCKMRPCIATTDMFHEIALNRNVFAVGILSASDFYGNPVEFTPSNFRKSAYRQYVTEPDKTGLIALFCISRNTIFNIECTVLLWWLDTVTADILYNKCSYM